MLRIKRRQFLQGTGAILATLGLNQLEIQQQGLRYAKVLAQNTPRKLALLVGINNYANASIPNLKGAVTDVHAQRELLTHRFGFSSKDILMLTDAQASRKRILQAFEEHLIKQAKLGDVVVFHYSGHGSQVSDEPDCDSVAAGKKLCVNSTIVPYDSFLSSTTTDEELINDIMGHTLFLLMSAVQTENLTVLLDCCHSGGGTRGNFLIRAIERSGEGTDFRPALEEKAYRQQWLSRLKLSPDEYIRQRRKGVAKGVVLAAARQEQRAADVPFGDFHAGAFSYTLTRYLWQQTSSEAVGNITTPIALSVKTQAATIGYSQDPVLEYKPSSQNAERPIFFLNQRIPPAEAVVTTVSNNQVICWLGGVDPETLEAFGKDAIFTAVNHKGQEQGEVKLTIRDGLRATGEILKGFVQPGSLLQEKIRGIPKDLSLEIVLDPSLENDLNQAGEELKQIKRVRALPAGQGGKYLLTRITEAYRQELESTSPEVPPIGSLGLLSPGGEQTVEGSFGLANETIDSAISRLRPKFTLLLARRLLQLIKNTSSSKVAVDVKVYFEGSTGTDQQISTVKTPRCQKLFASAAPSKTIGKISIHQVKSGKAIQVQVTNNEPKNLYIVILGIASSGEIQVLSPTDWTQPSDTALVKAKDTLKSNKVVIENPKEGDALELLVLASASPLRSALKGLQRIAADQGMRSGSLVLGEEAATVIDDLVVTLDENTRSSSKGEANEDKRTISTNDLAVISIPLWIV